MNADRIDYYVNRFRGITPNRETITSILIELANEASPPTDTVTLSKAEHDALVADAERYRWLCENKQVPWGLFIKNAHELGIDQAIDSAKGK